MSKEVNQKSSTFVLYLQNMNEEDRPNIYSNMQKEIEAYTNIFCELMKLLSTHVVEH